MIKLIVTLVIHGDGSNRYKHAKIFNQNYVLIQVPHIKKMIIFNASNHNYTLKHPKKLTRKRSGQSISKQSYFNSEATSYKYTILLPGL